MPRLKVALRMPPPENARPKGRAAWASRTALPEPGAEGVPRTRWRRRSMCSSSRAKTQSPPPASPDGRNGSAASPSAGRRWKSFMICMVDGRVERYSAGRGEKTTGKWCGNALPVQITLKGSAIGRDGARVRRRDQDYEFVVRHLVCERQCAMHTVFVDHASELLGVSRRTVYYWIRDGKLRTIRTPNGSQRVLIVSIETVLREEMQARAQL